MSNFIKASIELYNYIYDNRQGIINISEEAASKKLFDLINRCFETGMKEHKSTIEWLIYYNNLTLLTNSFKIVITLENNQEILRAYFDSYIIERAANAYAASIHHLAKILNIDYSDLKAFI